ncbi:MAG: iron-sulfur cluster assembly scaffold protein [Caulobacteraceae bacterium]
MLDDLYTAKILKAAANLSKLGRLAAPDGSAEKVSKLCGSRIVVDVAMEGDKVADFGQEVRACALGQAAAAVLAENIIGASAAEISEARDQFRAMLKEGGAAPKGRFADLAMLEQVRDYPPRHASSLLAFEAAAEACARALSKGARRTSRAGVG